MIAMGVVGFGSAGFPDRLSPTGPPGMQEAVVTAIQNAAGQIGMA
jgi:hypothetical protein